MKGVLIMGMFQDLNRISIAKQMPLLYKATAEIVLMCKASDNQIITTGISSIKDLEGREWEISAKINNIKSDYIVDKFPSLKYQPLCELNVHLYAKSVDSPEKIDLGYRKVVSCIGNQDLKNDNVLYIFAIAE